MPTIRCQWGCLLGIVIISADILMITPWVTLSLGNQKTKDIPEEITKPSTPQPIVEAQGWIINEQGQVTLVAAVPTATSHDFGKIPSGCQTILAH